MLSGLVRFCAVDDDADDAVDLAGLSRDGVERDEVDLGGVGWLCRVCCCEQSNHNNFMSVTVHHTAARNDDPVANIQFDVSDRTVCCS